MKILKLALTVLLFLLTFQSFAQDTELLSKVPTTKEEFIESESSVIATVNWLEKTPLNEQESFHQNQYALLLMWITNSPTVTIEINANTLTFIKKNADLFLIFMAGWTKYTLQNNYSKDVVLGNLAGIRSAIKVYQLGGVKKDKNLLKLVELDANGELENWVKTQLQN